MPKGNNSFSERKRTMKLKTSLLLVIFFFLFTSIAFANSEKVAIVEEIVGDVFVTKGAGKVEYPAKVGMKLYQGDSIRTGKNSLVKINFGDGDVTTLGENGKITIAELSETSDSGNGDFRSLATKKNVTVKQESGKTWTKVKNLVDSGKRHRVETATAIMGVRGTLFLTEIASNGNTRISVYDGQVAVDSNYHSNVVIVPPSQQHHVSENFNQSVPINFVEIFDELQPEMSADIIQDTIAEVEAKVQEAEKMLRFLEVNPVATLARQIVETMTDAELMVTLLERMLQSVNQSTNSEAIQNRLSQNITELIENANQLFENVQTMKQQMEQVIEQQTNISMDELNKLVEEQRKLIEEIRNENSTATDNGKEETSTTPTSSDDDDDSGTSPTPAPTPGEDSEPSDPLVPLYEEGTGISLRSLSWDEVSIYRRINENIIGGLRVILDKEQIQEKMSNVQYFAVRIAGSERGSYTKQQLMPEQGEAIVDIEQSTYSDVPLAFPTPSNWYIVIFYDEQQNPIAYYQQKVDVELYDPDKPTAKGKGYEFFVDVDEYSGEFLLNLKLQVNPPLSNDVINYEIYESDEPIGDLTGIDPTFGWDEPSLDIIKRNPILKGQPKYYYIVAVSRVDGENVKSQPLEIVVNDFGDVVEFVDSNMLFEADVYSDYVTIYLAEQYANIDDQQFMIFIDGEPQYDFSRSGNQISIPNVGYGIGNEEITVYIFVSSNKVYIATFPVSAP